MYQLKSIFNKVSSVCKDIGHGLNFTSGYGRNERIFKGVNAAWTGVNALQLAFGVAAVGVVGFASLPTVFTGLGLLIAYGYGNRR